MKNYLSDILKETNTIIIPGIGALTMTDRTSGEVMFMSFLKHDDGALAKFIAEKEGLGIEEAKDQVSNYVREIETKLSAGESYDMPAFGSFRKDNSGDITFDQSKQEEVLATEVVTKDKSVTEEVDEVEPVQDEPVVSAEPVYEEKEVEEAPVDEVVVLENVVEEIPVEEEAVIIEETPMQETVVEPEIQAESIVEESRIEESVQAPIEEKNVYTEEQQWSDDLDLPPVNATIERPKKPILEKAKADKKRRSPMLLILIIAAVVVLGGATTVVLFRENLGIFTAKEEIKESIEEEVNEDKIDEWYDADETENSEEEDDQEEEVEDKKPLVEEKKTAPVEVKKPAPVQSSSIGNYHIVAGAFGDPANAERLVTKLKVLGFNAQVLGQRNGLHTVSAGSFASQQEAERVLNENAANLPKAWILNKP